MLSRLFLWALFVLATQASLESKSKSGVWRTGEIVDIGWPERMSEPQYDPNVSTLPNQAPYPRALSSAAPYRVYVVLIEETIYAASVEVPGRKSYLGGLKPHDSVKCAVRGRSLYILDPKGRELRLQIQAKSASLQTH